MPIYRRKLYEKMLAWKKERKGTSALLIQGARRVGKSVLVEEFAKNEYKSYILIDFSNAGKEIKELFEDMSDLNFFFLQLQALTRKDLHERQSVIIFDEVQLMPLARQAIKHLVKDGRYDYIETGSLLTLKKNIKGIVIPSEETRLKLNPLDFEEFLWATGNTTTMPMVKYAYDNKKKLTDVVNRSIMRDLRLYMLVGGMPQAITAYLKTNNFRFVDEKKREILELYADDFRRIDSTGKATSIFKSIPAQLNSNANRYNVSSVIPNGRIESISGLIEDMKDSMVVNVAYHANDPNVGFSLHRSENVFKMYLLDTGLFITLAFWDNDYDNNLLYNKLLSDKLSADLGYVYENLVCQILTSMNNALFYYTFPKENSHKNYEIDFLISRETKICPIEVKSSGYASHSSLDAFMAKYSSRVQNEYVVYTKDYRKEGTVIYLPLPMLYYVDAIGLEKC